MKKILLSILSSLFFLVFFLSCEKENDNEHPFNYINLGFYEQFDSNGSILNFDFSTVETFPCNNFTLSLSLTQTSTNKIIRISDIDDPDVCISTMGPATHLLSLGPVANQSQKFQIWVNDKRHDFILKADEKSIYVSPSIPFEGNLFFSYDTLRRIPQNTVWGYVLYNHNKGNIPGIWTQVYKAFLDAGIQEVELANGNYYFFTIKDKNLRFGNVDQEALTFYFSFDKSSQLLINAYEDIIRQFDQPQIQLRLFDTRGERFIL